MENAIVNILSSTVEFNFGNEDTIIIKEIKCVGVNTRNFISVLFIPEINNSHDIDDFIVENVKVEIRSIKRDKIEVAAIAENGASERYKFKFIIQWQSK